ncbi:MAG: DNA mismatch repair endonuclease MutL [Bacilli bacterium]|nr:DNA mismatch repair endonuclease MutL [Bacilli bacterium]
MPKIQKLDQHMANLIAAGEVIERAASVVKELVENSIDADAKNITIFLKDSGIKEITVSDDGNGMDSEDARLSVLPHATSKIKEPRDLNSIKTLGFRGEALPSIVAVSHFTLKTSTDGLKGVIFSYKGGNFISEGIISQPKGTEISVKNLFYNTPARLQNIQSLNIELSYIVDFINKIALAHPNISFKLINNDKTIIQTNGNSKVLEVISNIYGYEIAKNMLDLFDADGYFKVYGFTSNLEVTRSNRSQINILVNNRSVRNFAIINAVVNGYEDKLMKGRYPISIIQIEVDPSLVDVNIHPTKSEVRFTDESRLLELIKTAIKRALNRVSLIIDKSKNDNQDKELLNKNTIDQTINFIKDEYKSIPENTEKIIENYETKKENCEIENTQFLQEEILFNSKETNFNTKLPKMYYIGQLFGTYILAQNEEKFYLIDQHAAMERINYEKIIFEMNKEKVMTQELIVPIKVDFSLSDSILIDNKINEIKELGIEIENFGSGSFLVRQIPTWIIKNQEKEFVEEILTNLIANKKNSKIQFIEFVAKSLACKESLKANTYINSTEVDFLIQRLENCDNPHTCPHGRPTIISLNQKEIEKWFKRII